MRWLTFAILGALSACSPRVENAFVVEDEQNAVATAKLTLCGSETPLQRQGERLAVRKSIDCEGSGHVTLRYATGDEHDCAVGYVTPGAEQNFKYQATAKGCE